MVNYKYSDKQNYRRFKTNVEPNILKLIKNKEEQSLIKKIREAFGVQNENTNYSKVETNITNTYEQYKPLSKDIYEKYKKMYSSVSNNLSTDMDSYIQRKTNINETIIKKKLEDAKQQKKAKDDFIEKMEKYQQLEQSSLYDYKQTQTAKTYKSGKLKYR